MVAPLVSLFLAAKRIQVFLISQSSFLFNLASGFPEEVRTSVSLCVCKRDKNNKPAAF